MKSIKSILLLAVVLFAATSCVEKSGKYQALLTQRDSLLSVAHNYTMTLEILNEIEDGFNSINALEGNLKPQITGSENQPQSKKQQFSKQLAQIKEILEQNKAKIAELQALLAQSGRRNSTLTQTVERLEAELTERTAATESLRADLAKKNIRIEELNQAVTGLNTNITELTTRTAEQQKSIAALDQELNWVWYVIGSARELKAWGILSGNGLFRAKTVLDKEFNASAFTQADLRNLSSIPTGSKNPKLLSSHPSDSYELIRGDDKLMTIKIGDPAKFWSISSYLVVQK